MAKSPAKKQRDIRSKLLELSRPQLVALAKQRTKLPYQELLGLGNESLATVLSEVPGVLVPVKVEG